MPRGRVVGKHGRGHKPRSLITHRRAESGQLLDPLLEVGDLHRLVLHLPLKLPVVKLECVEVGMAGPLVAGMLDGRVNGPRPAAKS